MYLCVLEKMTMLRAWNSFHTESLDAYKSDSWILYKN